MSSIRDLKKDINFLTSEIFTECYIKQLLQEKAEKEKLAEIMVSALKFRSDFIARTNHPDGKDNPKLVKAYYQKLRKDMYAQYIKMSEGIQNL